MLTQVEGSQEDTHCVKRFGGTIKERGRGEGGAETPKDRDEVNRREVCLGEDDTDFRFEL